VVPARQQVKGRLVSRSLHRRRSGAAELEGRFF
jgi:hypothetical protein